jgi:hypothetical protein
VKQYIKNKRKHHYKNGWLDVPAKYAYLKHNAGKRNPTASRRKKALHSTVASRRPSIKYWQMMGAQGTSGRVDSDEGDGDNEIETQRSHWDEDGMEEEAN